VEQREQDIERQVQKLRAMYQRAKMLAEKETESCLQCLAKVDDLIYKKTGEYMPQPAVALGVKRTLGGQHMDGIGNGSGPPKRQAFHVDAARQASPPLMRQASVASVGSVAKTPNPQKTLEKQVILELCSLWNLEMQPRWRHAVTRHSVP
jgi:hypothetical protein